MAHVAVKPFCPPETIEINLIGKYKFHFHKAFPRPLNVLEAKKCLKQFVCCVSESLIVLHDQYFKAHTDVRLEINFFSARS